MNKIKNVPGRENTATNPPPNGSGVRTGVIVLCVACLSVLAYVSMSGLSKKAAVSAPQPPTNDTTAAHSTRPVTVAPAARQAVVSSAPRAAAPVPLPPNTPASPETRQLVESIVRPPTSDGVLNPEQAGAWRTNLANLIQHGSAGVPAIREFLDKNVDLDFGQAGRQMLGYSSARLAMLDALTQIGGPDALGVMGGVLQSTADPREIAVLAAGMDKLDPGLHHQEVVDAARQTLAMAAEGKLTDRDVAPLFEVFQTYGDASLAEELKKSSSKWNYYAIAALAQLPEGAGIPELVKIVNGEGSGSSGARVPALQMIAQAAPDSEVARNALLDQVKQNSLTPYQWATLESILAGDRIGYQNGAFDSNLPGVRASDIKRTHIASGNQNFYTAPPAAGLSPEQVTAQTALIDQLMAVTKDPSGVQVLERARQLLARRSTQTARASNSPPQ